MKPEPPPSAAGSEYEPRQETKVSRVNLRVTTRRTSRICLSEGRTANVYGWNADFMGGNGSFITIQRLIDQHLNLCLATGRL